MPSKTTKDPENPIPERIVERMAAKNQNFAQAAREIGTTQAALQYIVNRGRGLGRDLAPRVADYLGMDHGDLFKMAGLAPAALNEAAIAAKTDGSMPHFQDVTAILADDPVAPGTKISLQPVLDIGQRLCSA